LAFDSSGEHQVKGENGGVKPFESVCIKGAWIQGKKDATLPALTEKLAGEGVYE
jgi:hypothetical protein